MKHILFAAVLALSCCASCATIDKHAIDLAGLKASYQKSDPVELHLTNSGPEVIRVYSNLEVIDKQGRWATWPFHPEDGGLNGISSRLVGPGESKTIVFDIKRISLPPIPVGEQQEKADHLKFRFRVVEFGAASDERLGEQVSEPFVVFHPYDP
jgi:hypothetical protein